MRDPKRWFVHELAFLAFGAGTTLALAARAGPLHPVTLHVAAATALVVGVVLALRRMRSELWQKLRLAAGYAFGLWFYGLIEDITPALGTRTHDATLLAIDRAVLGETPSVWLARIATPALTDVLSVCYLSYHAYLCSALFVGLLRPVERMRRLCEPVYTALALGYVGYLLVPAVGPAPAFPKLFTAPVTGGALTAANAWVVGNGGSVYDVFPSLHVAISLALMAHDAREERWRFKLMLPVMVGLVLSTLYLRYHYAVDLVAGTVLFLAVDVAFRRARQPLGAQPTPRALAPAPRLPRPGALPGNPTPQERSAPRP